MPKQAFAKKLNSRAIAGTPCAFSEAQRPTVKNAFRLEALTPSPRFCLPAAAAAPAPAPYKPQALVCVIRRHRGQQQALSRHVEASHPGSHAGTLPLVSHAASVSPSEALLGASVVEAEQCAAQAEASATVVRRGPAMRVFSFWQLARNSSEPLPRNAGEAVGSPVVLHLPAVNGGWMQQGAEAAAGRAAVAGAAVTCGDMLVLPLPLEVLDSPVSLALQQQPLPLLRAALQLQLQLRMLQQAETEAARAPTATLAAAANTTRPIVLLLRDPELCSSETGRQSQASGEGDGTAAAAAEVLRRNAAYAALRLLEGQWQAIAGESGMEVSTGQQEQQTQASLRLPSLRELYSVHVVFWRGHPEALKAHASHQEQPDGARPMTDCSSAVQKCLESLLVQHCAREQELRAPEAALSKHRQTQQRDQPLRLDSAEQHQHRATKKESPAGGGNVPPAEASVFNAEACRRRALARFRAELAETPGPAEGFVLLRGLLREFDAECTANAESYLKGTEALSILEIRQTLQDEALTELRTLYHLQLEALRSLAVRRFALLLQQLLSGKRDPERPKGSPPIQRHNFYELSRRTSDLMRRTADNFEHFIQRFLRAMDSEALQQLLAASCAQLRATSDRAAMPMEVSAAVERAAASERLLLLGTLRELSATALQQQQLLWVEQQQQQGLSLLQRLHQNASSRLLATPQGAAILRGWHGLEKTAQAARTFLGQLPGVKQVLRSPLAAMWRRRKPINVALHYLSPTAFGLSPTKYNVTLNQPWKGKLHVQELTSRTEGDLLPEETL
ncbi:uncharacterized protein LOC113147214 [Cyclospora cayetanensis]|uniref:Uncharacterized protein LOC113147214 n=1 Tax=Cyclospora cayetanensis TaxID=88456 RepID=A0A6P6S0C4_9EIME|nr:uncharacterized protein LOC113147214 [Cyclospora cayetanensis]